VAVVAKGAISRRVEDPVANEADSGVESSFPAAKGQTSAFRKIQRRDASVRPALDDIRLTRSSHACSGPAHTMEIAILAASVIAWGAVHSWIASPPVKDFAARVLGERMVRAYRLAYNAFAFISFMPILLLMRALPDHQLYSIPAPWMFFFLAGQAIAGLCLLMAMLQTDTLHFIGVRQLVERPRASELNTRGFYGLVRHPLYLFGLLFLWLAPIMSVNLFTLFLLLSVYLFVGARFEERRLLSEFGTQYEEYRLRTPMIIPRLRKARLVEPGTGRDADR
jgi:methanethiol S-methyltransferase